MESCRKASGFPSVSVVFGESCDARVAEGAPALPAACCSDASGIGGAMGSPAATGAEPDRTAGADRIPAGSRLSSCFVARSRVSATREPRKVRPLDASFSGAAPVTAPVAAGCVAGAGVSCGICGIRPADGALTETDGSTLTICCRGGLQSGDRAGLGSPVIVGCGSDAGCSACAGRLQSMDREEPNEGARVSRASMEAFFAGAATKIECAGIAGTDGGFASGSSFSAKKSLHVSRKGSLLRLAVCNLPTSAAMWLGMAPSFGDFAARKLSRAQCEDETVTPQTKADQMPSRRACFSMRQ